MLHLYIKCNIFKENRGNPSKKAGVEKPAFLVLYLSLSIPFSYVIIDTIINGKRSVKEWEL